MTDLARDLQLLAEVFKEGGWSELRVEAAGLNVLLSNDPQAAASQVGVPADTNTSKQQLAYAGAEPAAKAPVPPSAPASGSRDPNWAAVLAPNLGTFYRSPKPGSAPFVEIGDRVEVETEICLLEVMKLFTSVKAGVAGVVRQIAAQDAELVEGGRPLFYIEAQGN